MKENIKYSERYLKAERLRLGIEQPETSTINGKQKIDGVFAGERWKIVKEQIKEENNEEKKLKYAHTSEFLSKKEYQLQEMAKIAFNAPDAKWRKQIKSKPLMGGSVDVTYSLDRETFEVQLNFTPDMSQKEKINIVGMIKIWADKFEKNYLPDYGTQIMKSTYNAQ